MQRNFALQLRGQSLFIAWAGGVVTEDFLGGDHWIFRMTEKVISHKLSLNLGGGGESLNVTCLFDTLVKK